MPVTSEIFSIRFVASRKRNIEAGIVSKAWGRGPISLSLLGNFNIKIFPLHLNLSIRQWVKKYPVSSYVI